MRAVYAICGFLLLALVAARATPARATSCDRSYPDYCSPPPPPDLDCPDITGAKPFRVKHDVRNPDPHGFDRDGDGRACEPPRRRRS